MVEMVIAGLFALIAIASVMTLADCWVRGRFVFEQIERQQLLLDGGFVPMANAAQVRQRVRFETLAVGGILGARLPENRHLARTRHSPPNFAHQPASHYPHSAPQAAPAHGAA